MGSQNQSQKYNTFLSTQQSYDIRQCEMRQLIDSRPDAQEHLNKLINNKNVQITFRYYSPEKIRHSSINSHRAICSGQTESIYSSRQIDATESQIKRKVVHEPKLLSDKFYQDKIEKIPHSLLTTYENFHLRLLNQFLWRQDQSKRKNKTIKIKLVKDNLSLNKSPLQKNQKRYIKNVHINLNKQKKQKNAHDEAQNIKIYSISNRQKNSLHQTNVMTQKFEAIKRNKYKIKIKLYDNSKGLNEKEQQIQDNFKTPRKNNSNKKGIIVYSSSKYKKQQQSQQKDMIYKQNSSLIASKLPQSQNKKIKIKNSLLKSMTDKTSKIMHNISNQNSVQKTTSKKRAYSKQKLEQIQKHFENTQNNRKLALSTIKK